MCVRLSYLCNGLLTSCKLNFRLCSFAHLLNNSNNSNNMRSLSQEFYLLLAAVLLFCKQKRKRTETKLDLPWWLFIHKTYELLLFFLSSSILLCN